MLAEDGLQGLVYQCGLARAAYAGDHDELAQGEFHVYVFQVVAPCPAQGDALAVALAPLLGHFDPHFAVEVLCGDGVRPEHVLRRALEHHFAALASGLGAYVHYVVGVEHHVLVVLYHDDGVAQVAQLLERLDEAVVVSLVQADTRLVEDVEHVDQLGAYLRG